MVSWWSLILSIISISSLYIWRKDASSCQDFHLTFLCPTKETSWSEWQRKRVEWEKKGWCDDWEGCFGLTSNSSAHLLRLVMFSSCRAWKLDIKISSHSLFHYWDFLHSAHSAKVTTWLAHKRFVSDILMLLDCKQSLLQFALEITHARTKHLLRRFVPSMFWPLSYESPMEAITFKISSRYLYV